MEWTKLHSTNNNFVSMASAALQAVARYNLDWCTTLKIHGPNFGGWVSENYLALARINRWLKFHSIMIEENSHQNWVRFELRWKRSRRKVRRIN